MEKSGDTGHIRLGGMGHTSLTLMNTLNIITGAVSENSWQRTSQRTWQDTNLTRKSSLSRWPKVTGPSRLRRVPVWPDTTTLVRLEPVRMSRLCDRAYGYSSQLWTNMPSSRFCYRFISAILPDVIGVSCIRLRQLRPRLRSCILHQTPNLSHLPRQ